MIKGPVARAGSILYFSKAKGIKVPKSAANTITTNKDFQDKISDAVLGVSNIHEEIIDIDLKEATELSKIMLDYLPQFVGAFNYALRNREK